MLTKHDYHLAIYDGFIRRNEKRFREAVDYYKSRAYQFDYDAFEDIVSLCGCINERYGIDYSDKLESNYFQRMLWQISILGERRDLEARISMEWVLCGCLIDSFLDSDEFDEDQKKRLSEKLDIQWFVQEDVFRSTCVEELDTLINDIRIFLTSSRVKKNGYYSCLIHSMEKALVSEKYVSLNPLEEGVYTNDERCLLIDKSVEFENVAYMISVFHDVDRKSIELIQSVSKVIWLIDDMCDCLEDVESKRKNSLLFLFIDDTEKIGTEKRLNRLYHKLPEVYTHIEDCLDRIKSGASLEYYSYLTVLVWRWCRGIREQLGLVGDGKSSGTSVQLGGIS